jgi:polysaccharide export outer membrane protein
LIGLVAVWLAWGNAQEAQPEQSTEAAGSTRGGGDESPEYRVGAGDILTISVWKEPDVSGDVVVRPDGKISLPLVHDLHVGDQTPTAITDEITKRLAPYINTPLVTVTVREVNSKVVYVIGEVGRPGQYPVLRPTTVLQVLTQAGGLSEFAKTKSIYVLRTNNGSQERFPFNYRDVVDGKNIEQNIVLKPGDTVVVP